MQALLNRMRFPGSETIQSFIGRRILGAFSLIRTAILVMGVANILLFQYLDSAEVQERNKTAEQGKLDHLSFVVETQIQAYEGAVWETGKLPSTVSSARDLYTGEATADLLALRKLDPAVLAPGGALHGFVLGYLQLNTFWRSLIPVIEGGGDRQPLQAQWQGRQALITTPSQALDSYRVQVGQDQQRLQHAKSDAKQAALVLSGIIGLISFALSIALAVVLTRQIVPPVNRLRDALQQVARGDLSPQAAVRGRDEISQLLTTFNASVGRLRELLLAVGEQSRAIGTEAGWLKQTLASERLDPQEAAVLEDALAAAGHLTQATAGVAAAGDLATGPLAAERARVLDELTQAVEQISAHLGAVTSRADRLAAGVPGADGAAPAWLAGELAALDQDARAAAAQLDAVIREVRSTQRMTATSVGNLDRAASYLREAVAQFHLQS